MSAHVETVDGVRLPARLSGHPVLDFCNTWTGWDGNAPADFLRTYDDLLIWARFVGLHTADQVAALSAQASRARAATTTATLNRARRLRAGLHEVLTTKQAGPNWPAVAGELRAALAGSVPEPATVGLHWRTTANAPGLAAPITVIALSALELLGSAAIDQVRACPGVGCGWLFLDRSGRRRWCSMAVCGNRAKVRRFADRNRGMVE
jgi:predicted RNA-binding Zn ribbon-like protein